MIYTPQKIAGAPPIIACFLRSLPERRRLRMPGLPRYCEAGDYTTSSASRRGAASLTASPAKLFDNACPREIVARKIFGGGTSANESLSIVNRRAPDYCAELALCAWPGSWVRRPDH